jgi:hypothetical protein
MKVLTRRPHRLLLSLAVALILMAGWQWLITQGEQGAERCARAFIGGDERTSPQVQAAGWSWWPPGLRCHVTPNDGQPVVKVLFW